MSNRFPLVLRLSASSHAASVSSHASAMETPASRKPVLASFSTPASSTLQHYGNTILRRWRSPNAGTIHSGYPHVVVHIHGLFAYELFSIYVRLGILVYQAPKAEFPYLEEACSWEQGTKLAALTLVCIRILEWYSLTISFIDGGQDS